MKSNLVRCMEELVPEQECAIAPTAEATVLDGAAIVSMLRFCPVKTFHVYATYAFLPFIHAQMRQASREDIWIRATTMDIIKQVTCRLARLWAAYQTGHCWDQVMITTAKLPPPSE